MRTQLRTLSKMAAERVARHLVAAGRMVDEDPQAALEQARAARALGARVAVVREAVGETAYAAGEWAEAIAELRTARRMTGDDSALPMIADAERALGRPERALRIARSPEVQGLEPAERAEMCIVEAGARRDLGQIDAALVTLQDFGLDRRSVQPWSARVWYAYADLLLTAGREDEAREWFVAAAEADPGGTTDADERLLELDGIEILADEGDEGDEGEVPIAPTTTAPEPEAARTEAARTEAARTEAAPTDAARTDAARTDAPPTDAAPRDAAPTDAAPTDAARTDAPPRDAAPTDAPADTAAVGTPPAEAVPTGVAVSADGASTDGPGDAVAGDAVAGDAVPGDGGGVRRRSEAGAGEQGDAGGSRASAPADPGDPVPVVFSDQADQSGSSS